MVTAHDTGAFRTKSDFIHRKSRPVVEHQRVLAFIDTNWLQDANIAGESNDLVGEVFGFGLHG